MSRKPLVAALLVAGFVITLSWWQGNSYPRAAAHDTPACYYVK